MKKITILTPCFNEEGNVKQIYEEVKKVMTKKQFGVARDKK